MYLHHLGDIKEYGTCTPCSNHEHMQSFMQLSELICQTLSNPKKDSPYFYLVSVFCVCNLSQTAFQQL